MRRNFGETPQNNFLRSINASMNETLINLLPQNSAGKMDGKKEEGRRYNQVQLSIEKYFFRSNSQVHRSNATIWPNHQMTRAATKEKLMVLPAKICRILWIELTEKCGDWDQCNICNEFFCPKFYDKNKA